MSKNLPEIWKKEVKKLINFNKYFLIIFLNINVILII